MTSWHITQFCLSSIMISCAKAFNFTFLSTHLCQFVQVLFHLSKFISKTQFFETKQHIYIFISTECRSVLVQSQWFQASLVYRWAHILRKSLKNVHNVPIQSFVHADWLLVHHCWPDQWSWCKPMQRLLIRWYSLGKLHWISIGQLSLIYCW